MDTPQLHEPVESQFATVLLNYHLAAGEIDPFQVVENFASVTAQRCFAVRQEAEMSQDPALLEEAESWEMETKLWHLVRVLYAARLADAEHFLGKAAHELLLIIQWLQYNMHEVDDLVPPAALGKWLKTRLDAAGEYLDADAPLRSGLKVSATDGDVDDANYGRIYEFVLCGDTERAIEYASRTGNYTLALILCGAPKEFGSDPNVQLWLQTVLKLSQEPLVNAQERLIYSFLSGGDISANIKQAAGSWEECLLVYVNQLFVYHLASHFKLSEAAVTLARPQHELVGSILNTLLQSQAVGGESRHPFRIMMGSVMIDQVNQFLGNAARESASGEVHILRVLAHLAVVTLILGTNDTSKTCTHLLTRYIAQLPEHGFEEQIPTYLAFIPDEHDLRESYSVFLSTLTDPAKRTRQLQLVKRLGITVNEDVSMEHVALENEKKVHNVLKRTVERVMTETELHYQPKTELIIDDENDDPVDDKVCNAVEWFYENRMYEDAILATRTMLRRFLLNGKLKSFKLFIAKRSMKDLVRKFDFERETGAQFAVEESDRQELLQYEQLLECLHSLDAWKQQPVRQDSDTRELIDSMRNVIFHWLRDLAHSLEGLFWESRSIYVSYLVLELVLVCLSTHVKLAFQLVNDVANDTANDLLRCLVQCGRLKEFQLVIANLAAQANIFSSH